MLRLRRSLQPRVSNQLAAFSAVLLLVISVLEIDDSKLAGNGPANLSGYNSYDAPEPGQDALPAAQTTVRQGSKISLMIFH